MQPTHQKWLTKKDFCPEFFWWSHFITVHHHVLLIITIIQTLLNLIQILKYWKETFFQITNKKNELPTYLIKMVSQVTANNC